MRPVVTDLFVQEKMLNFIVGCDLRHELLISGFNEYIQKEYKYKFNFLSIPSVKEVPYVSKENKYREKGLLNTKWLNDIYYKVKP